MITIRRLGATVLGGLASLLLLGSGAAADWRDELPTFRIGILGGNLGDQMIADHACWKRMVANELGVEVELFASADYDGVIQGLLSGELHAAELGAASYAAIYLRDPDAVEPVVASKHPDGTLGHHSVMIVRADSPFETLDDLRGGSLLFTDPNSTTGFLVPSHELAEAGYAPGRLFGSLAWSGGHPQGVQAVLEGRADAALTWTSRIGKRARGFSRGNLRRMVDQGRLDMRDIRIVWQSKIIVEGPWVVRADVPEEAKEAYERLLVELPRRDQACMERMIGGRTIGFEPVNHEYYQTIIDIKRSLSGG